MENRTELFCKTERAKVLCQMVYLGMKQSFHFGGRSQMTSVSNQQIQLVGRSFHSFDLPALWVSVPANSSSLALALRPLKTK